MGKYSIILVSGFVITFTAIQSKIRSAPEQALENVVQVNNRTKARNLGNSVANVAFRQLIDNDNWRGGFQDVTLTEDPKAKCDAAVVDSTTDSSLDWGQVKVTSRADVDEEISIAKIVLGTIYTGFVPTTVRGGVTANSPVTLLGTMQIDGRDHDLNGNLIPGSGMKGISTAGTLSQGGGSRVGGTVFGVDFAPDKPAAPFTYETGVSGGSPTTPDEFMGGAAGGYPEGTLKTIAQSGVNGGQYVTNPSSLRFPLSGVTYVELDSGVTWGAIDFGSSSGILVVHNSTNNAKIENLNTGTFKGLILADGIEKIHTTIIGAVVPLSPTPSGNCIGNGTGSILYSSEALKTVTAATPSIADTVSTHITMSLLSWSEE